MLKIAVDIDGTLAEFDSDFVRVLEAQTGRYAPSARDTYFWLDATYTPDEIEAALRTYANHPEPWARLQPYPYTTAALMALDEMERRHLAEVFFVTARRGGYAKSASERWLRQWGKTNPTVLVGLKTKGAIAEILEADVFIDDAPFHIADVLGSTKGRCACYLIDRPYNRSEHDHIRGLGGRVVDNVVTVLEEICAPQSALRGPTAADASDARGQE